MLHCASGGTREGMGVAPYPITSACRYGINALCRFDPLVTDSV